AHFLPVASPGRRAGLVQRGGKDRRQGESEVEDSCGQRFGVRPVLQLTGGRMNWVFEPAGRVRRGGNAAAYAFRPDLNVFVREVVQNAKDQKRADAKQAK